MAAQDQGGPQGPAGSDPTPGRPSFYVPNRWRLVAPAAFGGASTVLTVTTVFYALGRLPLGMVVAGVVLAVAALGLGLYARVRAARIDVEALGRALDQRD